MKLRVIPISDPDSWRFYLNQVEHYDIYHTWLYHSLNTEGEGRLLVFEEEEHLMLLPLIVRDIPGTAFKDATSVYGYAGWICRQPDFSPSLFELLEEYMLQENVVSVFIRLHPLIEYADFFLKGTVIEMNTTTGIDMSLSPRDQFTQYSSTVKRNIIRSKKQGMRIRKAESDTDIRIFTDLYCRAMDRVGASPQYYFTDEYFAQLLRATDFETVVLLAEIDGDTAGGALFTVCSGIMQYHLGGVAEGYIRNSPLKVLIDAARETAFAHDCTFFHLGGGYGGKDDNLFRFKAQMTTLRYTFKTLQWIIQQNNYDLLSSRKKKTSFFPLYRSFE